MDYMTKPASRKDLRIIASIFRLTLKLAPDTVIEPEYLLDQVCYVFPDVNYEIVSNELLSENIPAATEIQTDGTYLIKIKERIFIGAVNRRIGGYRMHIVHELAHVFLHKLGYKPNLARQLSSKIEPMRSMEWQAKALAGEIMIPYEYSKNMDAEQIMDTYGVSVEAAKIRLKF